MRGEKALPIASATVSIRNLGTDFALPLQTNDHGIYISPPLHTGRYEITPKSQVCKGCNAALVAVGRTTPAWLRPCAMEALTWPLSGR